MSNPTRIGQEAPDKTPSSPSRITPTRALDDAEMSKSEPPVPKYPYAVDEDGVARVGYVAVDPAQHNKATELQLSGPRRRHLRDAVARRRRHLNVCAHAC
jgi:hypothetical protein